MSTTKETPGEVINKPVKDEKIVSSIHGYMFQLKLIVLFFCRGLTGGYSFKLGTEIKEAGKFDDLVFEFTQDGKIFFRLLQAKHKLGSTKYVISEQALLRSPKKEFYLPMYFFSYLGAKKKDLFSKGSIKDVIIYTNANLDKEFLRRNMEDVEDIDDILETKIGSDTKPKRYRFTKSKNVFEKLQNTLNNYKLKSITQSVELPDYSDDDIMDFINHLIIAVDSPSEKELDEIIKKEIEKQFDLLSNFFAVESTYRSFLVTMLDWLQGKGKGTFISDEEGKNFFEVAKEGIPVLFNIKSSIESFVGRDKELDDLYEVLKVGNERTRKRAICISGTGGVGKSELARKYISKFRTEYKNNVLWFNAESSQALESCFCSLASDKLGIATKNAHGEDRGLMSIIEDVYRAFLNRNYLLIFDNAQYYKSKDQFDAGLDKFLPPVSDDGRPYILITSRNERWPSTIQVLPLDKFDKLEAVAFISKELEIDNLSDCSALADAMHYFPLALQQAVSYIKVQNMKLQNIGSYFNISRYLNRLKEKGKDVLNFSFPEDSDIDYTKTVYITWNATLDFIRESEYGDEALKIMNILSYMDPENIPIELFKDLFCDNDEILPSALGILKQYSMITIHRKIESIEEHVILINVHGCVQQVIRLILEEEKRNKIILDEGLMIFSKERNVNNLTLDHAISLWNYYIQVGSLLEEKGIHCLLICVCISTNLYKQARHIEVCLFTKKAIECFSSLSLPSEYVTFVAVLKYAHARALRQMGNDEEADRIMDDIEEQMMIL